MIYSRILNTRRLRCIYYCFISFSFILNLLNGLDLLYMLSFFINFKFHHMPALPQNPQITGSIKSHAVISILNQYTCWIIDATRWTYRPRVPHDVWMWDCTCLNKCMRWKRHLTTCFSSSCPAHSFLLTSVHIQQLVHTLADRSGHMKSVWEYSVRALSEHRLPPESPGLSCLLPTLPPPTGSSSIYLTADIPTEI